MTGFESVERLESIGFREYHARALVHLTRLGEGSAPEVARASGIPKNRAYGVLGDLADRGYAELVPGRPKRYRARPPGEVLERVKENVELDKRDELREIRGAEGPILEELGALHDAEASTDGSPLLRVVSVGEPSERETRLLYGEAEEEVLIATKSMEYLPRVREELVEADDRGVSVRILLLEPGRLSVENREIQRGIVHKLRETLPGAELRFSTDKLPLRGTVVDPSPRYDGGAAVFLVEERDVPLALRDAAITENPSLVAGTARYFELIWGHESVPPGECGLPVD